MIFTNLQLAWQEITSNIMRSTLTCLGVIIGVAAVIIMVSLGESATANVTQSISNLGRNLLVLIPGQQERGGQFIGAQQFDAADLEAIREQVPGIADVSGVASRGIQAIFGNENTQTVIYGTDTKYLDVRAWEVELGRRFAPGEVRGGRSVCILGATPREELFGAQDPVGETIRLGSVSCQVIGVLESKGGSGFGQDQDDVVLAPLRMVQRRFIGNRNIGSIWVSARTEEETDQVQADIESLMRERRRIGPEDTDDFNVQNLKEVSDVFSEVTGYLTIFLSSVAAISLLVGGIGIMNIMLVSVTERTREIGIRLAIGALERDVLSQFLVEAVLLAAFGGVVGITLGLGFTWLAVTLIGWEFILNIPIVVLAVLFSAAIGIIFGYFPARRAARLDPIEALRYE